MQARFLFLLACVWMLMGPIVPARADNDDLLGDLDMAMEEEEVQVEADQDQSFAAQVMRNLDLSLRLRSTHHLDIAPEMDNSIDPDDQNMYGQVKLDFGTSYERGEQRLVVNGWLENGTEHDTYRPQVGFWTDQDRHRKMLEINELYLTTGLGGIDLTLGKRVINNKIAALFSPANRYGSFDVNDPLDMRRLGAWQVALEDSRPGLSWMLAYLPSFQTPKPPSQSSRWLAGSSSDGVMSTFYGSRDDSRWDSLGLASVTTHDKRPQDPGFFAQAKTTSEDWDFLFSAYRGPSAYPVLQTKIDTSSLLNTKVDSTLEYPLVTQLAAGFSTTWKDLEFHSEALYSLTDQQRDDDYVQFVLGTRWSNENLAKKLGMQRIVLGLEYAGECLIADQRANNYSNSSRDLRLGRNDLIAGLTLELSDDLDFHYLTDFELTNDSRLNRAGFGLKISERLSGDLSAEFFDGPSDSTFGYWRRQDRIVTTLTYKLH